MEGTNFATREAPPVTKTPTKDTTAKINNCMVKLWLKILHGANDVQETVLDMIDHCLTILHKQDKRARFVNKKKSLEAYKVTYSMYCLSGLRARTYRGNMLLPTRAVAKANAAKANNTSTEHNTVSRVLVPSLRPLSKCKALNESTDMATNTPTRPLDSKTPQPQGISPMTVGINDIISNKSPGTTKSNPKESDEESQGVGSLSDLIASTRKAIFESAPPVDDEKTVTTQTRKWVPIKKMGSSTKEDIGMLGSGIVCGRKQIASREARSVTKTPTKDIPLRSMNVW